MKPNAIILFLLLCFNIYALRAQKAEELIDKGNAAYEKKSFAEAQHYYEEAIRKDVNHEWPEAIFNLGDALYQQKKYDEASFRFRQLASSDVSEGLHASASYNLGNCYLEQENYEAALNAYRKTMKIDPHDNDARYNLMYTQKLIAQRQGSTFVPSSTEEKQPKEKKFEPPPLTKDDLNRMQQQLNESEKQARKDLQKDQTSKRKAVKDW